MSVSLEYTLMSSRGTPRTSAAIWPITVSAPVPRSVAPMSMLNDPSSLSLIEQPPMSRNGMAVPCMQKAKPRPRRMLGRSEGAFQAASLRRLQSTSRMPWATHSSIPDDMTFGYSSSSSSSTARSPRWGAMSISSPTLTQLRRLKSMGSRPRAPAMSSMWASRANSAWGAP